MSLFCRRVSAVPALACNPRFSERSYSFQYLDSCGIFNDAVLSILATIAKQERIRISERVTAGLERARKSGSIIGRPRLVVDRDRIAELDGDGWTQREIGEEMGISAAAVCRILKARRHHRPAPLAPVFGD